MSFAYFDSSVIVKRYVMEQGSMEAISLLSRHDFLSSAISPVEVLSALKRRNRSGDVTDDEFSLLITRIRNERARWELVAITETVLSWAEKIVQGPVPMRALDAIHIASSLAFQVSASVQVPFVTSDSRQDEAARQLGLNVVLIR